MSTPKQQRPTWIMPAHLGSPFQEVGQTAAEIQERFKKMSQADAYPTQTRTVSVSFVTNEERLEAMLPEGKGLRLGGEPVVSVTAVYQGAIGWLAGRTYDLIVVGFPVTFAGKEREVEGSFTPVVWENLTEPILAGRELLGWSKIYADIPPASVLGDRLHCTASWDGFRFLDMTVEGLRQLGEQELRAMQTARAADGEGSIHYKYIQRTGRPGEADADYLTISTSRGAPPVSVKGMWAWTGEGRIEFHKGTWEDLPTMVNVVNRLAELEVKSVVGATVIKTETVGGGMGETLMLE
jgi:hypothetical protein